MSFYAHIPPVFACPVSQQRLSTAPSQSDERDVNKKALPRHRATYRCNLFDESFLNQLLQDRIIEKLGSLSLSFQTGGKSVLDDSGTGKRYERCVFHEIVVGLRQ